MGSIAYIYTYRDVHIHTERHTHIEDMLTLRKSPYSALLTNSTSVTSELKQPEIATNLLAASEIQPNFHFL